MKKLWVGVLLFATASSLFGQGVTTLFPPFRGPNGQYSPFARLTFCTYPATFDSLGNCTNTVPVYQNITLTTTYSSAITTDGLGNFPPNQQTTTPLYFPPAPNYCYTATTSNTSGSNIHQPIPICTPFSLAIAPDSNTTLDAVKVSSLSATGLASAQAFSNDPQVGPSPAYTTLDGALTSAYCTTGCRIKISAGSIPCPTSTITVPVVLEGSGMGAPTGTIAADIWNSVTKLTNGSPTANCINVGLNGNNMGGVTIRDLEIAGNKAVSGASSGDCVTVAGGNSTTQIIHTTIESLNLHDCKGNGISLKDNVFQTNIRGVLVTNNGGHGLSVSNSQNIGPSQTRIAQATFWNNTGDGINMNGNHVQDVTIVEGTLANNANGANVVAGTANGSFRAYSVDFEANSNAGVLIRDGLGHAIRDSEFPADGLQQFGVNVDPPSGASFANVQIYLENNNLAGANAVKDVQFSAHTHNAFLGPQANSQAGYSFLDNSGTVMFLNSGAANLTVGGPAFSPFTNGGTALGTASLAWRNLFANVLTIPEFTAPSSVNGKGVCYADATAHALECSYNNGAFGTVPLINRAQAWSAVQVFQDGNLQVDGAESGTATIHGPAAGGGSINLQAGTEGLVSGSQHFDWACTGTATASTTIVMNNYGVSTCTNTIFADPNNLMTSSGTLANLAVRCGTGGTNASSGIFTIYKNGSATGLTCTVGTGHQCSDTTHTASVSRFDRVQPRFGTQSGETLANCAVAVEKQ